MSKPKKRWIEMMTEELAEATRQYDAEMIELPTTVPPPEEKARHDRIMRRGRGRPNVGKGSKRVLITVEKGLLSDADRFARRRGLSRSQMIAAGLRAVLRQGSEAPAEAISVWRKTASNPSGPKKRSA